MTGLCVITQGWLQRGGKVTSKFSNAPTNQFSRHTHAQTLFSKSEKRERECAGHSASGERSLIWDRWALLVFAAAGDKSSTICVSFCGDDDAFCAWGAPSLGPGWGPSDSLADARGRGRVTSPATDFLLWGAQLFWASDRYG